MLIRYVPTSQNCQMSFVSFFGPFLLGTGPLIVIFCLTIARKSFVVLLTLASAFYWLLILLIISVLFRAFTPLSDDLLSLSLALLVSVGIEQCANWGVYGIHSKLVTLLSLMGRRTGHRFTSIDAIWLSFGIGFGHALTHSLFFFVSLLEAMDHDATLYDFETCPKLSIFNAAALSTLGFCLFHVFSTIVFLNGFPKSNKMQISLPPITHFIASLATLINSKENGCLISIPILLAFGMFYLFWAAHLTWIEIRTQFQSRIHVENT